MSHKPVYSDLVLPATQEASHEGMTIDELARRTGMTVRNIRAHQSRGLLPAPEVRGRTGYYGDQHIARIELIREMQSEGLNLEAIRRMLEGVGGASSEMLDFTRALRAPFEDEEPEILTAAEIADRWGADEEPEPAVLSRAEKLGVLREMGEGRYEVISPRLLRAGGELAQLGVSPQVALDVVENVRRHAQGVARTFIDLFVREVWEPFDAAGRPEEDWQKVLDALERLRPLASDALLAIFGVAMTEATEEAFARTLQRDRRDGGPRRGSRRRRR
jgi:DNA-binding transcriptional MerR regulator